MMPIYALPLVPGATQCAQGAGGVCGGALFVELTFSRFHPSGDFKISLPSFGGLNIYLLPRNLALESLSSLLWLKFDWAWSFDQYSDGNFDNCATNVPLLTAIQLELENKVLSNENKSDLCRLYEYVSFCMFTHHAFAVVVLDLITGCFLLVSKS